MCISLHPINGPKTNDCFFITLSTLLKYYKNETYLHNACLWDFRFEYSPGLRIEDCLFEDELYIQHYDFILQTTGLALTVANKYFYKQTIFTSLENNKPIIIHYDSYFCPWSYNYLKYHYDHFFIIVGYHNSSYICVDSFLLDESCSLSEELFDKGIMHIVNHEYKKNNASASNIIDIVNKNLQKNTNRLGKSKMFNDMLLLADCILNIDSIKEFERYSDVKTVPLFTKIQNIMLNRNALSNVTRELLWLTGQEGYREISKMFTDANQEWNMFLVLFMKFFLTGMENPQKNTSAKLKDIAYLEIQIAENLNKLF